MPYLQASTALLERVQALETPRDFRETMVAALTTAGWRSSSDRDQPPQPAQQQQQEGDEDDKTEIERLREANIRRNAEVLLQAGLGGGQSLLGRRKQQQQAEGRKKVRGARVDWIEPSRNLIVLSLVCTPQPALAPPKRPPQEPTRRSLRNLGKEAPDYREAPDIRVRIQCICTGDDVICRAWG